MIINTYFNEQLYSYISENNLTTLKELKEFRSSLPPTKFSNTIRDTAYAFVHKYISNKGKSLVYKTTNGWKNYNVVYIDSTFSGVFKNITMFDGKTAFINFDTYLVHTFDGFNSLIMDSVANNLSSDQTILKILFLTKTRAIMLISKSKICFYDMKLTNIYDNPFDIAFDDKLTLYPIPLSKGTPLNIKYEGAKNYNALNIDIIDMNGKIIDKNKVCSNNFTVQYLPESELIPGTYFIVISSNGEVLGREKFIVVE